MSRCAIIDPHVHFFNLQQGHYHWLHSKAVRAWPNYAQICKPFSEDDLIQDCPFVLQALVHIEAGFDNNAPIKELHWLESTVQRVPYKAISYVQIDQDTDEFIAALQSIQSRALVGIRDITEAADAKRLLNKAVRNNLAILAEQSLLFEAQYSVENIQITQFMIACAQALPDLKLVINHLGLPQDIRSWRIACEALSLCENIYIKFSGIELLSNAISTDAYLIDLLETFGSQRIVFASNFPVCHMQQNYTQLWTRYYQLVHSLDQQTLGASLQTSELWRALSFENARRLYQFF